MICMDAARLRLLPEAHDVNHFTAEVPALRESTRVPGRGERGHAQSGLPALPQNRSGDAADQARRGLFATGRLTPARYVERRGGLSRGP